MNTGTHSFRSHIKSMSEVAHIRRWLTHEISHILRAESCTWRVTQGYRWRCCSVKCRHGESWLIQRTASFIPLPLHGNSPAALCPLEHPSTGKRQHMLFQYPVSRLPDEWVHIHQPPGCCHGQGTNSWIHPVLPFTKSCVGPSLRSSQFS